MCTPRRITSALVCDYLSKSEQSEQHSMWKDILTSTKSLAATQWPFFWTLWKADMLEQLRHVTGYWDTNCTLRQVQFADLHSAHQAKRVFKPAATINYILNNHPYSEDIFQLHLVLDVYPNRQKESSCLHDVMAGMKENVLQERMGRTTGCGKFKPASHEMPKQTVHHHTPLGKPKSQRTEQREIFLPFVEVVLAMADWKWHKNRGLHFSATYERIKHPNVAMVGYQERYMPTTRQQRESDEVVK